MVQLIRRSQVDFGKIDAKSALVTRDAAAKQLFLEAFAAPKRSDIEAIRSGDRYLFYGTKGSGKTALLRYMMELERKAGNVTRAIVFSEDITLQEKSKIADAADLENVEKPQTVDGADVRDMWKLFVVQKLTALLSSDARLFDYCREAETLGSLVSKVFDDNKLTSLQRILSGLKSGSLIVKGKASEFAEIEAILNWEKSAADGGRRIDYSRFAEVVVDRLCSFRFPEDVKYILYMDELNLSMIGQNQHKRDSILIRDLIITIGNLNRIFAERSVPIYLYAAVRVEIAKAISISRNEIDKYLVDHGHKLQWHGDKNVHNYPIFTIVENRIAAVEKSLTGKCNKASDIWQDYFARDVYGVHPKNFLSEITWCNPRDIVNLFNLASRAELNRPNYDTDVFSSVLEDYSEIVWTERAEELNSEHNMAVVQGIKRFLTGGYKNFKVEQFAQTVERKATIDPRLMQISKTVGPERICRDLYYVGVLGQSSSAGTYKTLDGKVRHRVHETWFYRDNREFDPSQWMIVHRALYPCLKIARLRAGDFGSDPRYEYSAHA